MASLRAVGPDEKAVEPKEPMTVEQAAKSGDQYALLVAMRDRISEAVSDPKCPHRDLASLTRRLDDIADKIAAHDAQVKQEGESGIAPDEAFDASAV